MEDKTFDLLTKMYSEVTNKIDNLHNEMNEFRTETNDRLTKLEMCIENEIKPDIKASLEGYNLVYKKLREHDLRLDSIDNKLDRQEIELTVIKGGKKFAK